MKIVKFVPEICKDIDGKEAQWEGFISFRSASYDESIQYKEMLTEIEQPAVDDWKACAKFNIQWGKRLVDLASKHVVEVDLKKKDGSAEAKSFDDMKQDDELHATMNQFASRVIVGPTVGKN